MSNNFYNNSGVINNGNYADNGSTINISNGQSNELGRLIQQLREAMADTDKVLESEKNATFKWLELIQKGGAEQKPLTGLGSVWRNGRVFLLLPRL